ncbi:MAG: hypothetical protein GX219_00765 [Tissierellia bacterium]|nr:hypothetical protein [Tissierellia bacterium]
MKKSILRGVSIFAVAVMILVGVGLTAVEAANLGPNYLDADNDGVCDYCATNGGVGRQVNAGRGRQALCTDFVDADKDGICDNYENRPMDGTGKKLGRGQGGQGRQAAGRGGQGQGLSENFVDVDSDGVCDNYVNRPMDGTGKQLGRGRNR